MIEEKEKPIIVEFPLEGEWLAPTTPGHRIPSHGTEMLGQKYAYDFVKINWEGRKKTFYEGTPLKYNLIGVPLKDCYGWAKPILSPVTGKVIKAKDGWPERQRVYLLRDLLLAIGNGFFTNFDKIVDMRKITGNYIIIEAEECFCFLAHARMGSIRVKEGDTIIAGQIVAEVGHSGNSTAPHLHFHLMDKLDILKANGLPCAFRKYEIFEDEKWKLVSNGIPNNTDRIRSVNV